MPQPVLELREIRKSFGPTVALDGVNLEIAAGEVHALIGENGAGKSTLMNVLSGALQPDSGSMSLRGDVYRPTDTLHARRNGISLIHQELMLAPHLSVAENILMGIEKASFGWINSRKLNAEARRVLESFDHPEIRADAAVGKLSITAQQVVEICRAIALKSEIVLMDEPTSSLPRHDVEGLFEQIRKLKAAGITIIYISHFLEEIREIADTFTVLRDGKSVASGRIADVTDEFLVTKMVGRPLVDLFPKREPRDHSDIALKVANLYAPPALQNASFELRRGEVLGIAGLMGSGRSELVRAIFGLEDVAGGEVVIGDGRTYIKSEPSKSISHGMGYLSEDRKTDGLGLSLSVADNVTMTRYSSCSRFGWIGLKKQGAQTRGLIDNLGIKARDPVQSVKELSGGNQQKVSLARLVHQDADIFLLDEPTRGIDIGSKAQIYETIAKLADNGKAVLMVSSYLPELFGMCDRLAVMSRGSLSAAKPITDWTPESVMQAAVGVE